MCSDTSLLTEKKSSPVKLAPTVDMNLLKSQFMTIKEAGNNEFKKKDGTGKIMAIAKFTEGINLFLKNAD